MKLRYATRFGKRAGTCWRLIFVYALMPWLHKYRISARPEQLTCSSKYLSTDIEKQFPSLNFISLHNFGEAEDSGEGHGRRDVAKAGENAMKEPYGVGAKPMSHTGVPSGAFAVAQSGPSRMLELEEENRLLKLALIRATRSAGETDC